MIVDASVAVKWLIDEEGSDVAEAILMQGNLGAPDLLFAEIANVLWKRRRRGDFDGIPEGVGGLAANFDRVVTCAQLMAPAAALAVELDHPTYDCFYLAMAIAEDDQLVTANARFLRACAATPHADRIRALA